MSEYEYKLQVKKGEAWETVFITKNVKRAYEELMEEAKTAPQGTEFRVWPVAQGGGMRI